MDAAIRRLRARATCFSRLSINERLRLAQELQRGYLRIAERSVSVGCQVKGISRGSPAEAEEWATGPWGVIRQLRLIRESLSALQRFGNTSIGPVGRTPDGRLSVSVFPGNALDGVLFKNWSIHVQMQAGVTEQTLETSRARFYKERSHDGKVVLVLGAGNIAAIPVMDALTFLFNEGRVCLVKLNPVNAYLGPCIEEAFAEAIRRDFLAVVHGGAEEGRYLAYHPEVDEVHITGSHKTHDSIVWGPPGPAREARIQSNDPLLRKPISSELGNITPVIVVPGPYTDGELRFQAEDTASALVMNASFLCNAAKMLLLPASWKGSDAYLRHIRDICATVPPRQAYYPGAEDRWRTLTSGRPSVQRIGQAGPGTLPWTFIDDLDPDARDEPLYTQEPFCSVIAATRLGSADPVEFLDAAVEFANRRLWGTLTASLVAHPKSLADPCLRHAMERAIARLRYGTVTINCFSGQSFVSGSAPWGAYPGARMDDIQSGRGFVHNTAMLDGVDKVVVQAPLTAFPKPGYFPTHRTAHKMLPRIVALEERARWSKVPAIVFHAMRG